jgi:hypothetical protein
MQFAVKKTVTPEPNTALITVHNLSADKRNQIATTGTVARLEAGFKEDPQNVRVICDMDVVDAQSSTESPNVITRIAAGDGMNAKRSPAKSYSYAGGKSVKDILSEVVADAGLTLRDLGDVVDDVYHNGFSEAGPFDDIMNKLAGKLEARWSIQNGEVMLTRLDQPAQASIISVNAESGLIRAQRRNKVGTPKSPAQKDGWVARALLLPIVEPGAKVKLKSEDADGIFMVAALTHTGDTHSQEWFTDLELEEFDG